MNFIKENINYNPETGVFTWKVEKNGIKIDKCGSYDHGYIRIKINGKLYFANKIAWFLTYNYWPKKEFVDHINGIRDDNRIINLRLVSPRENGQNRPEHRNGKLVGYSIHKKTGRYRSLIMIQKKQRQLGMFDTKEEAHEIYKKACEEIKNFGEGYVLEKIKEKGYQNRKIRKGYYFIKAKNKWVVSLYKNGKYKHIGAYETKEKAKEIYEKFILTT